MFYRNVMILVIGMLIIPSISFSQERVKVQGQRKSQSVDYEEQKRRVRDYGEERSRYLDFDRKIGAELRRRQDNSYRVIGFEVNRNKSGNAEFYRINGDVVERIILEVDISTLGPFLFDAMRKGVPVNITHDGKEVISIIFTGILRRKPVVFPGGFGAYSEEEGSRTYGVPKEGREQEYREGEGSRTYGVPK